MAQLCVVGAWHQASVVGPCLAELGHTVVGTALDQDGIRELGQGRPPVSEPGLEELLGRHLASGRLRYTSDFAEALVGAEAAVIALDTPVRVDDSPDLDPVMASVRAVAGVATRDILLVVSAQVPIGTCDSIGEMLRSARAGIQWSVAYVPEFLRLGEAVALFMHPDRLVIGADDPATAARVEAIYAGTTGPRLRTSVRSAEMAKHASNAFLAASVSFINELAGLCEATGSDALEVAAAMKLDPRIGPRAFLAPGLGFAGGTLGRDVRALQAVGASHGRPTALLDAVIDVNTRQTRLVLERLRSSFSDLSKVRVALLGLTYKPGTSALRRSASVEAADALMALGAGVAAHDPLVPPSRAAELPHGLSIAPDPLSAAAGADALVVATEWPEYATLDWRAVKATMKGDLVIDARNALVPAAVAEAGLRYWGIGRVGGGSGRSST